jgi:hypothetical protein
MLSSHFQSTLTVTPTIPLQDTTLYTPHKLVGIPSHQRMQNLGTQLNPNVGQIPTGGQPPLVEKYLPEGKFLQHTHFDWGETPYYWLHPSWYPTNSRGEISTLFHWKPPTILGTTPGRSVSSITSGRAIKIQPLSRNTKSKSF